jgi:predicted NodU family carbamoyl transferase
MYTLGINAAYHDSAACLVQDGVVVAAAEDERFTHVKHAKRPVPFSTWELPSGRPRHPGGNTSFNTRGEPIVCTPRDAIESYLTSPLDALVIGSFLLQKPLS